MVFVKFSCGSTNNAAFCFAFRWYGSKLDNQLDIVVRIRSFWIGLRPASILPYSTYGTVNMKHRSLQIFLCRSVGNSREYWRMGSVYV